VQQTNTN